MYIDSLTIAALVLFIVAVSAFVRFCVLKHCGLTSANKDGSVTATTRGKQK